MRDAQHDGGVRDRIEDRRDKAEDVRDRREDAKDRAEDVRDRRENVYDRNHGPDAPRGEVRERVLDKHDANGDGKLSDAEKLAAREAYQAHVTKFMEHRQEIRSRFDADGNGRLTGDELKKAIEFYRAHRAEYRDVADAPNVE
ncbi:MAG TPA: hypothetical protein VFY13_00070 [Luteolibacter sp.]|nr:hypothetical protein [Luteolibacter sp.]